MLMTHKGMKRAKGLCKSVGLLVNLEVDLNDKSRNKITINMYDRHLMPIVEDLYFTDQTQQVRTMKQDPGNPDETANDANAFQQSYYEKQTCYFASFIASIENEVMDCLGSNNTIAEPAKLGEMIGNQNKKLQAKTEPTRNNEDPIDKNDVSIMAEIFEDANRVEEEDEPE